MMIDGGSNGDGQGLAEVPGGDPARGAGGVGNQGGGEGPDFPLRRADRVRPGEERAEDARDAQGDGHRRAARGGPAVILVDSCGWLEYLADGASAGAYAKGARKPDKRLGPASCTPGG